MNNSAKNKGLLPVSSDEIDVYERLSEDCGFKLSGVHKPFDDDDDDFLDEKISMLSEVDKMDHTYLEILHVAALARDKIWNSAVLPPRQDSIPRYGTLVPRIRSTPEIKPWGRLNDFKSASNKPYGLVHKTHTQYMSKKFTDSRWVC